MHRIPFDDQGSYIGFSRCIGNFYDKSVLGIVEAQRSYEKGNLPYPGTLMEQPAKIIEIFGVIENHRVDRMIDQQKQAEQKRKQSRVRGQKLG